ncbi:MAG TPA: PQQ-binding-like beta-propeller repeat protein [Caulobacterales bacterium]|nr:PQQ-binding-like beta-propeller repeat protein [Caulobacterales bacterium]
MKRTLLSALVSAALLAGSGAAYAQEAATRAARAADWTTWGYGHERPNWNRGETTLTKANIAKLKLLWSSQLSTKPTDIVLSTLTAPLVVQNAATPGGPKDLVILLGADDTLFAVDANSGRVVWQKTFVNTLKPLREANWLCPNSPNATPTIDKQKGIVYFITSDGKLRAASLSDGAEKMAPTDMVAPFARAWSLNLIDDVVYTTSARGCGNIVDKNSATAAAATDTPRPGSPPPDPSNIAAMDVRDPAHPVLTRFFTSGGRASGPWGRGGVARTHRGVITQTADGQVDPASGNFGSSVLLLAPHVARLVDSFTASNWRYQNTHDLDLGSGSVMTFPFAKRDLAASIGKEGVLYLLDTANLGGSDHATPLYQSPQLGNDAAIGTEPGQGMWGALATYESPAGKRYLYIPMWGPPSTKAPPFKFTNGAIPHGSIMAFQLSEEGGKITLIPQWTSPDMIVPDSPTVANGIVFAMQTGEQTLQRELAKAGQPAPPVGPGAGAQFRATPVSNLVLYAFDAETGKQLYSSKKIIKGWTHFSEPVVALGKVFIVTHDGQLHAFGLRSTRK